MNDLVCPKCNKGILKPNDKNYSCDNFQSINNYCDFTIYLDTHGANLNEDNIRELIQKKYIGPLLLKTSKGVNYYAFLYLDNDFIIKARR